MASDKSKAPDSKTPAKGGKPDGKPAKTSKKNQENITDRLKKWLIAKKNEYWAEFKRIVWPTRETLMKETVTVIVISLMFGAYVAILDGIFGVLLSQFSLFATSLFS